MAWVGELCPGFWRLPLQLFKLFDYLDNTIVSTMPALKKNVLRLSIMVPADPLLQLEWAPDILLKK